MEELKVTSAAAYKVEQSIRKLVTLPSGSVFEIRKITGRDYLREGGMALQSSVDFTNLELTAEKNKILFEKMTADEKKKSLEVAEKMVIMAVTNPILIPASDVTKIKDNEICIKDVVDTDFYFLLKEITDFSFGKKDLEFFREKSESPNP